MENCLLKKKNKKLNNFKNKDRQQDGLFIM